MKRMKGWIIFSLSMLAMGAWAQQPASNAEERPVVLSCREKGNSAGNPEFTLTGGVNVYFQATLRTETETKTISFDSGSKCYVHPDKKGAFNCSQGLRTVVYSKVITETWITVDGEVKRNDAIEINIEHRGSSNADPDYYRKVVFSPGSCTTPK